MPGVFARIFRRRKSGSRPSDISAVKHIPELQDLPAYSRECVITHCPLIAEPQFKRALRLEQQRCERAGTRAVLALLQFNNPQDLNGDLAALIRHTISAVQFVVRDTDTIGWYREGLILGVLFAELGQSTLPQTVPGVLTTKLNVVLTQELRDYSRLLQLSFHSFPESSDIPILSTLSHAGFRPSTGGHS